MAASTTAATAHPRTQARPRMQAATLRNTAHIPRPNRTIEVCALSQYDVPLIGGLARHGLIPLVAFSFL
jgi:hypothetical protein